MTRTLRFGKVEREPAHGRAGGHAFDERETLVPRARFAEGTPWPPRGVTELAAAHAAQEARPLLDDPDELALTMPVPREELESEPLPPPPSIEGRSDAKQSIEHGPERSVVELEVLEVPEIDGSRTLMGIGARAVRAVAKSGWVEARPARREPRATPAPSSSRSSSRSDPGSLESMRDGIDGAAPPLVIVSPSMAGRRSSLRAVAANLEPVQPLHLPPEELLLAPAAPVAPAAPIAPIAPVRPPRAAARAIAPVAEPAPAFDLRPRGPARARGKRTSPAHRALGLSALALAVAALAAYITTTVFYAFSTSWVMPVVISASDDKVVALKSSLAAQQHQRDRLVAEAQDAARALAAAQDPRSEVAQQASAQQRLLEASIARQDEIIRGLEQSPYLRAIADRASVALVPYDNLDRVAPGTKVLACRVAMVMCREVGRVREVLPGEVSFKHPRREKMMRGQMIELELSEPGAAARDVLFLGDAPLLF